MRPLPATAGINGSDGRVALTRCIGRALSLRILSRWDQNLRWWAGPVGLNRGIDGHSVVRTVSHRGDQRAINLSDQHRHLRCISRAMGCQRRCENVARIGIDDNVQLSPRAALGWTGAWNVAALDAQARAVNHDVKRSVVAGHRDLNVERFGYRCPISCPTSLKTTRYHSGEWVLSGAVHQGRNSPVTPF